MALEPKEQEQISRFFDIIVEIDFLDPAVRSEPLNQNGGHSTVLPRADGSRVGGLGKQELVLQGMCCSSTSVRGLLQGNPHHANALRNSFFLDRNQGNRQEEDQLRICIEKTYKQESRFSSIHRI